MRSSLAALGPSRRDGGHSRHDRDGFVQPARPHRPVEAKTARREHPPDVVVDPPEVTVPDAQGQLLKRRVFYVRRSNGTKAIADEEERERYIAERWGTPGPAEPETTLSA
jgi:hypothetical protein